MDGIVCLYDKYDNLLNIRKYTCASERGSIIDGWKSVRGKIFFECAIHISPCVKSANKSRRDVEYMGELCTLNELSKRFGIKYTTLKNRLRYWKDVEKAVTFPVRQNQRA